MLGDRNTKRNVKAACLLDSVEGLVSIQGPGFSGGSAFGPALVVDTRISFGVFVYFSLAL